MIEKQFKSEYSKAMKDYFFKAIIESCEEGGAAYVPSLSGCVSEGETYEECSLNIREAMEL